MAVRHAFPECILPELRRDSEPEKPPLLTKKPKVVDFRPGKDIAEVCKDMKGYHHVRLGAAVGTGKSTRVPREVVRQSGKPLIHIVPTRTLAVAQFDYMTSDGSSDDYTLCLGPTDKFGESGVTITYSAAVWSILLSRQIGGASPLGDVSIFLDESHESDAYTYGLLKLLPNLPGLASFISSSATHELGKLPMRETDGSIEARTFPCAENPSTWDPADEGKPWSMTSFPGNALLFVESETHAQTLVGKYNDMGATAYRLSAQMSISTFRDAMRAMNDPRSGIIVLIADYSYRSGFTFNVDTIVDSGLVGCTEVLDGRPKRKFRVMYRLEQYQAQGRGGRTAGSKCVYFSPDYEYKSDICCLEGVETDVAALLFRGVGLAPPVEIRRAKFAVGYVPVDWVRSLNSTVPLVCQSADEMHSFILPPVVVADTAEPVDIAKLVDSYDSGVVSPKTDYFGHLLQSRAVVDQHGRGNDGITFLQSLGMKSGTSRTFVNGNYYYCKGLPAYDVTTRLYGDRWDRALSDIVKNPDVVTGFTDRDRHELIACFMRHYTEALAKVRAIDKLMAERDGLMSGIAKYPQQVKEWTEYIESVWRDCDAICNKVADAMDVLRPDAMVFVPVDPPVTLEQKCMQKFANRLVDCIKNLHRDLDHESYHNYVADKVIDLVPPDEKDAVDFDADRGYGLSRTRIVTRSVRIGDKYLKDVHVEPKDDVAEWGEKDYVRVIANWCDKFSFNVNDVNTLYLPGSRVDSDRVLQRVRDSGSRYLNDTIFKLVSPAKPRKATKSRSIRE